MAKLFAEKLQNLEIKINEWDEILSVTEIKEEMGKLEAKIESINTELKTAHVEVEGKINQLITELSAILTSYAQAINALTGKKK